MFALLLLAGIALPSILNRPTEPPVAPTVSQVPPAQTAAPLNPLPVAPSDDDLVGFLNDAISKAQEDWDTYLLIRADQFLIQAKKSENVERWLLDTCSGLTTKYQQAAWKQGTFEGNAKDSEQIRTLLGDSLACLLAVRRIREGETTTGRAIQPQPYLDKARITLGQYAAKLGVSVDAPQPIAQTNPSRQQPAVAPTSGEPNRQ
ncbi:hypothetical protein [Pantanalinema sp. GBBB05]|uniref:hypothetical protein n=1 Tax=Pantanalinema sp. GBBB05 TaxID=2604139 RepID=UPI003D81492D